MSVMCTDERSLLCIMSRHTSYRWLATSLFWYSAPTCFLKRFWKTAYPTFNLWFKKKNALVNVKIRSIFHSYLMLTKLVCPKIKLCWQFTQAIQDVDEFVSSSEQIWRNVALYNLLTNGSFAVNGCHQNESPKYMIMICFIFFLKMC